MAEWPYNTARWQRLRLAHLAMEPMCRGCAPHRLTVANHVDHVRAISDGGHPFPSHEGLRSYCGSCHSKKTARGPEAGAYRRTRPERGCSPDGTPTDPAHPWRTSDADVYVGDGQEIAQSLGTRAPGIRENLVSSRIGPISGDVYVLGVR